MLTPKQAAVLLFVDPTFKPGPMVLGSLRVAKLTDENDQLTRAAKEEVQASLRTALRPYFVHYFLTLDGKERAAGPYHTPEEAADHLRDIAEYEGVSRVEIRQAAFI